MSSTKRPPLLSLRKSLSSLREQPQSSPMPPMPLLKKKPSSWSIRGLRNKMSRAEDDDDDGLDFACAGDQDEFVYRKDEPLPVSRELESIDLTEQPLPDFSRSSSVSGSSTSCSSPIDGTFTRLRAEEAEAVDALDFFFSRLNGDSSSSLMLSPTTSQQSWTSTAPSSGMPSPTQTTTPTPTSDSSPSGPRRASEAAIATRPLVLARHRAMTYSDTQRTCSDTPRVSVPVRKSSTRSSSKSSTPTQKPM